MGFEAAEAAEYVPVLYQTFWALVPPLVAILLALITKEVYSSLFAGVIVGGLIYSYSYTSPYVNPVMSLNHIFKDGLIKQLSDEGHVGILIFLVFLGIIVAMMNKAGGSAAFGEWASKRVHSRRSAMLATTLLGCLIFIDDYFNCLTVGSVMRPVTDKEKISRAKLAYLIDATAAPVCIIAPISSWAAAVSDFAPEGTNGIMLFIRAIPYNYYALLSILMIVCLSVFKIDYGPMKRHELNALNGDLFTIEPPERSTNDKITGKGKVVDLVVPVIMLILFCVIGMIYTGGFFEGKSFIDAFAVCDASLGLAYGAFGGIVFMLLFYIIRGVLKFTDCMSCVESGFKAMVPPIAILTLAWTLKAMTDSLGADEYVAALVQQEGFKNLNWAMPAIIFLIACGLSFATGTSWATFGILIPITLNAFPLNSGSPLAIICMSACMAGAVCGDHCSPISDTTIMSSAGAQCNHIAHVSTQLPYALTAAAVSFVVYLFAGILQIFVPSYGINSTISLVIGFGLMIAIMFLLSKLLPTPESKDLQQDAAKETLKAEKG
ncbi:MAG: Na+/H+ antiporter NhaC family protein [Oscillospiraceae bacterium]|nr:Na+/H+ antiporter NhaC family protein [Oscillospiraceae bacterium]